MRGPRDRAIVREVVAPNLLDIIQLSLGREELMEETSVGINTLVDMKVVDISLVVACCILNTARPVDCKTECGDS